MKPFVNSLRSSKGEIATILTLISVILMLLGVTVGSYVAQKETRVRSKAVDSTNVKAQNISNYCLGDTGIEGKVATTLCLAWGQGGGKSIGLHYCCDECDSSLANSWAVTCYRPIDINKNTRGPGENTCEINAGIAFPLRCVLDTSDNKWKWVNQNDKGECNISCSTGEVSPSLTQAPSNTPIPIENTPTPVPNPLTADCNVEGRWECTIGSWTNCLGPGVDKQGLFNRTYCIGELMWKYQAALAHGANGDACEGKEQKFISDGCGGQPPTPTPTSTPTPRQGGPDPFPTDTPTPVQSERIYCHSCIGEGNGTCDERILVKSDNQTCQGVYMRDGSCLSVSCPKNTPTTTEDKKIYCHSCIGVYKDTCNERVLLSSENKTCQGVYMEDGSCYVSTCRKPLVIENPSPTPTNTPTPTPTPTPTATPSETPTPTPFINSAVPLCKFIDGGDQANPDGKLNVVLIADGFTDLKEFLDNAQLQVKLMSLSGLKEEGLYSKMNFWANTTLELGMVWIHPVTKIDWDRMKAILLMSNCKGQAYVIISKSFNPVEAGLGGMGPWNGNGAVVHASYIGTLAHELGHAINGVGLGDEYFPAFLLPFIDLPNCSDQGAEKPTLSCWKWKYLNDDNTDCLPGCTFATWYRPTDNSVMRYPSSDLNNPSKFNKPSLEAWRKGLEKYRL